MTGDEVLFPLGRSLYVDATHEVVVMNSTFPPSLLLLSSHSSSLALPLLHTLSLSPSFPSPPSLSLSSLLPRLARSLVETKLTSPQ